ncbi:TraB/GumN family protein [Maricaulaceae bacterium MS644]
MKKLLKTTAALAAGLLAGLSLAGAVHAQTDYAAIEANPALWSISDEDSTVYLFGTVHILPPELTWRTPAVDAALDESGIVYLEADVSSPEAQTQMQALIPQLGLNEEGVTLSSLISDEAQAHMATIAERLGAPPEALAAQMDPLKPWLASVSIAVLQIQAGGYDPMSGVEYKLTADAMEAGKEFGYFETAEEQLGYLAGLPMETQIADFEVGIAQMAEDPDMLSELVQAWAAGDMDTLDRVFNEDMRDASAELYEALIVQRNRNWIPQIEAALATEQNAFVAVGAGHMPGETGVIALLEANGHTVTRH